MHRTQFTISRFRPNLSGVAAASLLLFMHAAVSEAGLYAIDFGMQLHTINPVNASAALVGNTDVEAAYGLDDYNGNLYSFDQEADTIKQLDPNTGATLTSIPFGADLAGEGSLAFRSDGVGFLTTAFGPNGLGTGLYSFTLSPNSGALVGDPGFVLDGIDFQPGTDVLFALEHETLDLYTLDQTNGSPTLVGTTGILPSFLAGLAFAPDGTLYAINRLGALFTLNPGDGTATFVGDTGLGGVSGLSWLEEAVVPEPSSLVLLGMGAVGFVAGGMRRRQQRIAT